MSNASTPSDAAPVLDPLEKQAREFLAARRWRKAREELKVLVKKDRAKFLPLLIEANVGLAREMISKGLVSEAQQVFAYLKTIAPPAILKGLELELAAKSGSAPGLETQVVELLAAGGSTFTPSEKLRWADQLVVKFAPPPAEASTPSPAEARIVAEVRAVQEALGAISAGNYDCALDSVRALARDSLFSHWRLFIKGLAAFHRDEADKAGRAFAELPAGSGPMKASEPYRLLLGTLPLARHTLTEPVLEAVARLTGHAGWGRLLLRTQTEWQDQRHIDAYKVLRDGVRGFPAEGLDAPGVLSDFFFKSIFTVGENASYSYENYFLSLEEDKKAKNAVELMLIRRTFCQFLRPHLSPDELTCKWEGYLTSLRGMHGANARRDSLAYGWLGEVLGEVLPAQPFYHHKKPRLRSATGAIDALKKGIELDPSNVSAHLRLCAVYGAANRQSERNRLLDTMTTLFPDNKEALLIAGTGCQERKAFVKGLEYFERARQLDRIDPRIPDAIVSCSIRLARQHYEKGRLEPGRRVLARAGDLLIEKPENFLRNPWCHLARRGVLEELYGDAALGAELLQQARTASPFPAACLLFACTARRIYSEEKTPGDLRTKLDAAAKTDAKPGHAAVLARLLFFWSGIPDGPSLQFEEDWLRRYMKAAARQPCARAEGKNLFEVLKPHPTFHKQAEAFVKKVLSQDRLDPLFRLYQLLLESRSGDRFYGAEFKFQSILDEATRRGDEEAAKLARQAIEGLKTPQPLPVEPDWEDEEDYDGPEDWDEGKPNFGAPQLAPKEMAMFGEVLALLGGLNEAELRNHRKHRPPDMPAEVFDMLVSMVRGGKLPPLPKFPPVPKPPIRPLPQRSEPPRPQPESRDPNQMDLF
ncbi:MAG: hypothetical protein EXS31_09365 [Pedosphaera sp.]|nr:hypothetical protein [Pedosphaera sp.]